ncbi:hypothetical protein TNCV_782921 [Trichonephila clavipes]|nr:hypothetical protein TNCV_782921 [Trichonephila clavipes]
MYPYIKGPRPPQVLQTASPWRGGDTRRIGRSTSGVCSPGRATQGVKATPLCLAKFVASGAKSVFCRRCFRSLTIETAYSIHECVPSHVGISSNMRDDQKAKQEAEWSHTKVPVNLRKAKNIMFTYIEKHIAITQNTKSRRKPWETLATVGPISRHLD